ncbi:MAG: hypothetical protein HYZ57_20460, partial [Acidobacteria bacterium]|nr:hypothetical protein [Acidobacteriota bacterium]
RDTYARPTHAFFGVTSDRAISVAEFWTTTTSTYVFMDDFTTATLNPESSTPDPQTWLLAATGLVLVAFRRVRYGRP